MHQRPFWEVGAFYSRLNEDLSHFTNSNDICTPLGCVKEMVDTIPDRLLGKQED